MFEESDGRLFGREARIWNRSLDREASDLGPGDRALGALLWVDGVANHDGVHQALEICTSADLDAAADGFAYFGLDEVAAFFRARHSDPTLASWTEDSEPLANERYWALFPDDAVIGRQFQRVLRERPQDFAPLADD